VSLAWLPAAWWPVVYVLASYRITRLITRDSLPPLPRMRQYVFDRWEGRPIAELIDCPWCMGFWISTGVVLVASTPVDAMWRWLALPLALSTIVGCIASRFE
jgi:hypothetical protein